MRDNIIILRTILQYYLDRQKEFYRLKDELKTCYCFPTRKVVFSIGVIVGYMNIGEE